MCVCVCLSAALRAHANGTHSLGLWQTHDYFVSLFPTQTKLHSSIESVLSLVTRRLQDGPLRSVVSPTSGSNCGSSPAAVALFRIEPESKSHSAAVTIRPKMETSFHQKHAVMVYIYLHICAGVFLRIQTVVNMSSVSQCSLTFRCLYALAALVEGQFSG